VISSQNEDFLWIFDLVGKEQTNGLDALSSSINIVTQEQVVWLGRKPSILEESEHVVVLTMNISTDFEGRLHFDQHGLAEEYILHSPDDAQNDWLLKFDELPRFVVSHFEKGLDGGVDVDFDFLIHV